MSISTEVHTALAEMWEQHMHDGAGEQVAVVFTSTLRDLRNAGVEMKPFTLTEHVISRLYPPADEDNDSDGLLFALAANAIVAMTGGFRRVVAAHKQEPIGATE